MMDSDRAFAAILCHGKIAMVRVDDKGRSFWTLPGGGVEKGESREEAAVREAMEETNLAIKIVRFLFERKYAARTEYCYLAELKNEGQSIKLGHDPEFDVNDQVLKQAEWVQIGDLKDDLHVSRVIARLSPEEITKYNIDLQR